MKHRAASLQGYLLSVSYGRFLAELRQTLTTNQFFGRGIRNLCYVDLCVWLSACAPQNANFYCYWPCGEAGGRIIKCSFFPDNFLFIPCCRLSWRHLWVHVKYFVSYRSMWCERNFSIVTLNTVSLRHKRRKPELWKYEV